MARGKGQKVNRRDLASIFGASLPTVDTWVAEGCPYDQEGGRGREWIFDTADVSRWLQERATRDAGGTDVQDEAQLKKRKLRADVKLAELELLKACGQVAPVDQVERVLSRVLAEIQSTMRGPLVTRLVTQCIGETDERAFKRVALAEIDTVLEALADLDVTVDDVPTDDEDAADDA
jgi:phage terminase Nu1 subunit (DNA packaging protein)